MTKKAFKAVNKEKGLILTGIGIREACKTLWGCLPNGQPKYISSAIESALGIRTKDVHGWVFSYVTNNIVIGGKPTNKKKGGYTPRSKPTIISNNKLGSKPNPKSIKAHHTKMKACKPINRMVGSDPISQAIKTY